MDAWKGLDLAEQDPNLPCFQQHPYVWKPQEVLLGLFI